MLNLDRKTRPKRAVWLAAAAFAALAFVVAAALPDAAAPADDGQAAAPGGEHEPAARGSRQPQAPRAPQPSAAARTALSLLAVLALIAVAALGASRWLKRLRVRPGGDRVLEVVDAVPLGPKRQVFVVSAYGRRLVVGAAGDRLCLLAEIDEEDAGGDRPSFEARLAQRLGAAPAALEAEA